MTKTIFITTGMGTSGKDTLATLINRYMPVYKCSIINPIKEVAKTLGWKGDKTEKDRKFLSDLKDVVTSYNDFLFKKIEVLVENFKGDIIEKPIMIIDLRDSGEIERAKREFNATAIFIERPNSVKIIGNHADKDVKEYGGYDCIIENNGSLDDLEWVAQNIVNYIIQKKTLPHKFQAKERKVIE